jgi:hypothetical protein
VPENLVTGDRHRRPSRGHIALSILDSHPIHVVPAQIDNASSPSSSPPRSIDRSSSSPSSPANNNNNNNNNPAALEAIRTLCYDDSDFLSPEFTAVRHFYAAYALCHWAELGAGFDVQALRGLIFDARNPKVTEKLLGHDYFTLLHAAAQCLGLMADPDAEEGQALRAVLRDLVRANNAMLRADLRGVRPWGMRETPLVKVLSTVLGSSDDLRKLEAKLAACDKAVGAWLGDVAAAGVDLERYGRAEREGMREGCLKREFNIAIRSRGLLWDVKGDGKIKLLALGVGPEARDWKLWWSDPTDGFAGEFWRLVEAEAAPMRVPGAWVE